MKLVTFALLLSLSLFGQKGGRPSSPSRSYSPPSRPSQPSDPSRSYGSPSRPSTPSRTYGASAPSKPSAPSRTYSNKIFGQSAPSRTYVAPRRSVGSVSYGGRSYYAVPYYRPPMFFSHGYYYGYGDYVPWYAYISIWHTSQAPIVINANGSGQPQYYDAGQTSFNWLGLIIWMTVIGLIVWAVFAMNRAPSRVYRHY